MRSNYLGLLAGLFLIPALDSPASTPATTLDQVRERGTLRCGVDGALPGMSLRGADGAWSGLDVDFCRAVAAAALGDAKKVELVPLSTQERLDALAQDQVDLLSRNTTWTLSRDTGNGMTFAGILYYDGQGLMVPAAKGHRSTLELDGIAVCVQEGTTSVDNVRRYFTLHRMGLKLVPQATAAAVRAAYLDGQCDAVTSDHSSLHALRSTLDDPKAHRILPEVISKEPLGPAVRKGDAQWLDIVRWTLFALLDAEEYGIDSANVERARAEAKNPDVRLFLGADEAAAAPAGLDRDWAFNAVRQVGNYGELFERNLDPLGIKRGLNALWRDGGLMYAPPIR